MSELFPCVQERLCLLDDGQGRGDLRLGEGRQAVAGQEADHAVDGDVQPACTLRPRAAPSCVLGHPLSALLLDLLHQGDALTVGRCLVKRLGSNGLCTEEKKLYAYDGLLLIQHSQSAGTGWKSGDGSLRAMQAEECGYNTGAGMDLTGPRNPQQDK